MRKVIYCLLILTLPILSISQNKDSLRQAQEINFLKKKIELLKMKKTIDTLQLTIDTLEGSQPYIHKRGKNYVYRIKKIRGIGDSSASRITFIAGVGASYIPIQLYAIPIINQTSNAVIIENAARIKSNFSVGIVYSPSYYDIKSYRIQIDSPDIETKKANLEHVARGWSYAAFFNPISFSKVNETTSFFNTVDFGIGFGYRTASGFLAMVTAELFSVRQPRDWFVNKYKNNDSAYIIDNAIQKSIEIGNDNIFKNRNVITFGFKICYTFEIAKRFTSEAKFVKSP